MLSALTGFIQSRAIIISVTLLVTLGGLLGFTRWQNEKLREQNLILTQNADVLQKQLRDAEVAIVAAEAAGERRQNDRDAFIDIERAIREEEVTAQCANSPAIQRVLASVRNRRRNIVVTSEDGDTGDADDVP